MIRIAVPIVCKAVFCFCANETESESADDDLKLATDLLELAVRRSPSSKSGNAADPKSLSADQSIKVRKSDSVFPFWDKRESINFFLFLESKKNYSPIVFHILVH